MNVSILQENLLKALTRTSRIISTKTQLPILQNVLLSTETNRFRVVSSSLDISETARANAKIEKEGGLCVPARLFTELVMTLPQDTVRLVVEAGTLRISCLGTKATIPGVAASEFPPVVASKRKKGMVLEKDSLIDVLGSVLFCAATDEGRPLLTGVKIRTQDGEMLLVATDGYRLSVRRFKKQTEEGLDLVVPARALSEVVKISQEEKDTKEIEFGRSDDGQLVFSIGDTEIVTRLIDGEYPGFEKIIPKTHATRVLVDKQSLARAVKSAAIFARDNANIVRFHIENQTMVVSANTPQVGENSVELDAKIDGDGGDIAFNSRFLIEFLANFSEEELLFEMTGALNPGVFKPVKDESRLHIIMPVRVQA